MTQPPDADAACRLLHEAASLIREDPIRKGSLLEFGSAGQVVMTGDFHGNLKNFEKLQQFCALERSPGRCALLHELIHEDMMRPDQLDLSIDLLLQAAQWKCDFPDSVYVLQSNHELAQLRGQEITKGGRSVLWDFEHGVEHRFGDQAGAVLEAVRLGLRSRADPRRPLTGRVGLRPGMGTLSFRRGHRTVRQTAGRRVFHHRAHAPGRRLHQPRPADHSLQRSQPRHLPADRPEPGIHRRRAERRHSKVRQRGVRERTAPS